MSSSDDLLCASAGFLVVNSLIQNKKKKRKPRRWWMTTPYKNRSSYNTSNLLDELRSEDSNHFRTFCRMPPDIFDILLDSIAPKIEKQDTNYRKAIPPKERLAVTLHYLATGNSYSSLAYTFKISKQLISSIIPEVCSAIVGTLKSYIKMPQTPDEWLEISRQYEENWNFPHCLGAMDGKHIQLQAPFSSGSNFFNYKSTFSIVLFALVDADYNFLYADVGCQGRISDGGVFRNTTLSKKLEQSSLNLPNPNILPGRQKHVPYVFVADEAFPLKETILKPYAGSHEKGSPKRIFNYRLSRARRIVENVFGILSAVFRVLRKPMLLEPEKAELVVMACIYLHNFLRKNQSSKHVYTPNGSFDSGANGEIIAGSWRQQPDGNSGLTSIPKVARKSSTTAEQIRAEFAEYFITSGTVPWQNNYA